MQEKMILRVHLDKRFGSTCSLFYQGTDFLDKLIVQEIAFEH